MTHDLRYGSLVVPVEFRAAHASTWQHARILPREVRLLVLHSAECSESATAAEALAGWATSSNRPKASWHYAVDSNSITQSVELDDIAWHAGQANGYSIGIEQAGKASQSEGQWSDEYSCKMLDNTARLLAVLAGMYDLPLDYVETDLAIARGVTTHAAITRAFKVRNGHTDPGPRYPIEGVLAHARALQTLPIISGARTEGAVPESSPTTRSQYRCARSAITRCISEVDCAHSTNSTPLRCSIGWPCSSSPSTGSTGWLFADLGARWRCSDHG